MKYSKFQLNHHAALKSLAHVNNKKSGVQIWRHLRKVECAFTEMSTAYCNGKATEHLMDNARIKAKKGVFAALGLEPAGLYINSDPRGYALKIDRDKGGIIPDGMHRDWGGYGILAPIIEE